MPIVRWAPLMPSFDDFDKFFDGSGFVLALDVYQTKDTVVVETPLAGIDPNKVNISIENDILTIEGATEHKTEVDEKNYYRKEVRSGAFHRSVALPASVDGQKAKATYAKGVLKIEIPKEERAKPKTVKIEIKE
ncbi:MAG: Heat shock protein Hsp20 [Parcubacteria group bacterium GW2011_GWD2_43_10]|uniref:SHSP domain-containing protein n=1 Tax=Candidatus Veblenbacteria bacterium RIFOXYC2_FULL_42_11 TaxID=1802428 RepID=A0A1G2Q6W7_9BACT|nr:MAG: Heat shock protein Hsp20 [Parcubacteria group bacterium GW2011_GWA2_42_80]KKS83912.1 MAG: Heat shock protein Hsp20 [Parcubacteria group bacterium GW2011_GWD2_43_10]OHA56274.1 MAG: hypothetical protein A2441_02280 [Candidatus Veblenbacteria bacterium RIFOXYC2_FULL_42_11]HBT92007.1 molecular chaperone [Candidatus Veblenbacteria bacterium]HCM45394.1 molecular chaperone [Candidatus Veblenbacteria bacterium]